MTTHGQFHWNELMTRNVEQAKAFYHDIVGWEFEAMKMGDGGTYWIARTSTGPVGGIFDISSPDFANVSENWVTYLHVDNLDDAIAKMKGYGGELKREPFEVPGVGRIAMIVEPGGASIGWITPASN